VLGFRYDGGPPEDPAKASGDPGARAPHVALVDGRSTLDLVDPARPVVIGPGLVPIPQHRERWERIYAGPGVPIRPDGVISNQ
jgi:putative polyketide hydroxylase